MSIGVVLVANAGGVNRRRRCGRCGRCGDAVVAADMLRLTTTPQNMPTHLAAHHDLSTDTADATDQVVQA